jgi:hypothetical protein
MSDTPTSTFFNWVVGTGSTGVVISTVLGFLPPIAAVIAFVWYCIQIYESPTVQRWNDARLRKKLIRLHQRSAALEMRLLDLKDTSTRVHFKEASAMRIDIDSGLQEKANAVKKADAVALTPTPPSA